MATVVNLPAESATPEPNFDISTFSPAEYSDWEKTGKIPDAKPAAESSDAEIEEESQAGASTEDEPAAESAPAQSQEQTPSGKKGAATRIQELLRERNELRAKLAGYEKPSDVKPVAESSNAATTKPAEQELKRPARPVFGQPGHESETWEQFEARQDSYIEAVADYKAKVTLQASEAEKAKQAEESKRAEQAAEIDKTFRGRIGKATEKHADYAEVAFSAEVPITPVMDGFIRSHETGAEVLYYLGQHVDEAQAIAGMNPFQAAFALSKIALSLAEPDQSAPPPKKEAPVVPITKAAKPATDLRATSAAPVDDLAAAVEAGDIERFDEIRNRQMIERRKRG